MNLAHLFEAGMLVCFGFSWPINVVKAYRAGTAKSTSLAFICLIITGYVLGISAKVINQQFNYVLGVYLLNLVIVFTNVLVYFRNCALDKKREVTAAAEAKSNGVNSAASNGVAVLYAHEEHIVTDREEPSRKYNIALLGGTYAKDIPAKKIGQDFNFELINRSSFALSIRNAREYFEKYVASLNSDGIIIQLGKEDRELFKANPSNFDTIYLEFIAAIRACNSKCRLALVSINNSAKDSTIAAMNNHISAIAQAEQAVFVNLENASLWNPKAVQSSLDFAGAMGLNVKKPIYDVAQVLYSYAARNIAEEEENPRAAV